MLRALIPATVGRTSGITGACVFFAHLPRRSSLQLPFLFLGYLSKLFCPFQRVLFSQLAADGTIHHVRHSSLELLRELLYRDLFVAWLPLEELPRFLLLSLEALFLFSV